MKISTINLFQFCNPNFSYYNKKEKFTQDSWDKKILWLEDKIKSLKSDIIAFQEVFTKNDLESLCIKCGYKYFVTVDDPILEKNIFKSCVVALASKHPIKEIFIIKEENFTFSRKPIKVNIEIEKRDFIFYIVHLKSNRLNEFEHKFTINNTFNEKYEKCKNNLTNETSALFQRFNEVKYLSQDIKETLINYPNIIIAGDFNDKLNSFCLDIIKSNEFLQDILENKEIKNNYKNHLFDAFDFSKNEKRKYTSYFMSEGNIIDYILVSQNLKNIKHYEVDDYHLKDNKNGSLLNSDHAIVSCSIDLK